MHRLPHAENRADDCGHQRPQPYVQLRSARDDRSIQDSKLLHELSHGQDDGMGAGSYEGLVRHIALACELIQIQSQWRPVLPEKQHATAGDLASRAAEQDYLCCVAAAVDDLRENQVRRYWGS